MIQPYDFPERLMSADPEYFLRRKLAKTEQGLSFFDEAAVADWVRCMRDLRTVHAMCEDYRATATVDLDMDTADFDAGRQVECPALVIWGATGGVGRHHQPEEVWPLYAARHPADGRAALRPLSQRGGAARDRGRTRRVLRRPVKRQPLSAHGAERMGEVGIRGVATPPHPGPLRPRGRRGSGDCAGRSAVLERARFAGVAARGLESEAPSAFRPSSQSREDRSYVASEATGAGGLAERYATALFDLADERKALDAGGGRSARRCAR